MREDGVGGFGGGEWIGDVSFIMQTQEVQIRNGASVGR